MITGFLSILEQKTSVDHHLSSNFQFINGENTFPASFPTKECNSQGTPGFPHLWSRESQASTTLLTQNMVVHGLDSKDTNFFQLPFHLIFTRTNMLGSQNLEQVNILPNLPVVQISVDIVQSLNIVINHSVGLFDYHVPILNNCKNTGASIIKASPINQIIQPKLYPVTPTKILADAVPELGQLKQNILPKPQTVGSSLHFPSITSLNQVFSCLIRNGLKLKYLIKIHHSYYHLSSAIILLLFGNNFANLNSTQNL